LTSARRFAPEIALALIGVAIVGVWIAVASVSTCLNETPEFLKQNAAALPTIVNAANSVLHSLAVVVRPLVHADGSCQSSTLAWFLGPACALYLAAVLILEYVRLRPSVATSIVLAVFVASHAVLLTMPALLSTDVFAYASYGRIAGLQGGNPYIDPSPSSDASPSASSSSPEVQTSVNAPYGSTVYGPLWTRIDATVAQIVPSGDPVQQLFAYRVVATLAQVVNLAMVWWLTGKWVRIGALRSPRVAAFALYALSPLALFELAGDAHNEAIMLASVLFAFVLLTLAVCRKNASPQPRNRTVSSAQSSRDAGSPGGRPLDGLNQEPVAKYGSGHAADDGPVGGQTRDSLAQDVNWRATLTTNWLWMAALLVLILGALVKFVPLAIALVVAVVWQRQLSRPSQRIALAALVLAAAFGLTLIVSWPWLQSSDILRPVFGIARGGAYYRYAWQDSPADILKIKFIVPRMPDVHDSIRVDLARNIVWGFTRAVFIVVLGIVFWRLTRRDSVDPSPPAATLRTIAVASTYLLLAATLLLLTQVLAWYFLWTLPMIALLGWRSRVARCALFFGLSFFVAFYMGEFQPFGTPYLTVYALIALALLALSEPATGALNKRSPVAATTDPATEPLRPLTARPDP
jgi:hypothetical protein